MKSIILTIKLKYFYLTYKGIKTIEVRKSCPKDFVGDVYEIVSKTNFERDLMEIPENEREFFKQFKGKVGLKFTLNKVEEIINYGLARRSETMMKELLEKSCLTMGELNEYAPHKEYDDNDYIYAWHISNLEIFDKPKELSEFRNAFKYKRVESIFGNNNIEKDERTGGLRQPVKGGYEYIYPLTKAPQSWCYAEV